MGGKSTIYEVARQAQVSIASVSRVLHDQPGVSAETRTRVRTAMRQLGYVPSGAARGLASSRLGVIGLVFPDLDDPTRESGHESLLYFDEVVRGAERTAREGGLLVMIAATHRWSDRNLVVSVAGKVDGLVVMARCAPDADVRRLSDRVPIVVLAGGRRIRGTGYVGVDNEGGARAATRHLVEAHGYTDIGFLAGPANSPDSQGRFVGFRRAMAEAGLPVPERPLGHGEFNESSGREAIQGLLRSGRVPRAIMVGNDQMAVGVMSALTAAGVAVPGQVAVTGFDDIQLARHVTPALTTVHQPMRELGSHSVRLLLDQLEGRPGSREVILPTALVIRESCGCPPACPEPH